MSKAGYWAEDEPNGVQNAMGGGRIRSNGVWRGGGESGSTWNVPPAWVTRMGRCTVWCSTRGERSVSCRPCTSALRLECGSDNALLDDTRELVLLPGDINGACTRVGGPELLGNEHVCLHKHAGLLVDIEPGMVTSGLVGRLNGCGLILDWWEGENGSVHWVITWSCADCDHTTCSRSFCHTDMDMNADCVVSSWKLVAISQSASKACSAAAQAAGHCSKNDWASAQWVT